MIKNNIFKADSNSKASWSHLVSVRKDNSTETRTIMAKTKIANDENKHLKGYSKENTFQPPSSQQGEETKSVEANARMLKSSTQDKKTKNYVRENETLDGIMLNSQVYGFSMRRKRNTDSSTNQPETTIRSFSQYNDIQSSRCQSNISLDSLLTQYKHNSKAKNPSIQKKVN